MSARTPSLARALRSARIDLPSMTAHEALLIYEWLSEVATSIWNAHEPEIGHLAADEALRAAPEPDDDLVDTGDPDPDPDIPF